MKAKLRLISFCLAIGLICINAFGVNLYNKSGGGAGDRPKLLKPQYPPVVTDVQTGLLHLSFTANLGIVEVALHNAEGLEVINLSANTSYQNELWINVESGTYTLTVKDKSGGLISQESVNIP